MVVRVMGVIPTFRPPHSVVELSESLSRQVDHVIVTDDASPCTSDPVLRDLAQRGSVSVLRHTANAGIARGLNEGLRAAHESRMQWLLTVDQDSWLPDDYVLKLFINAQERMRDGQRLGAIGAEIVADASGSLTYPVSETPYGPVTEELIQTGTLWSVSALIDAGGFDESLGIDAVDAAACLRLRQRGYSLAISKGAFVEHSIGSARVVRFLGRNVMITGHSPERRSSMLRNRLRLFPAEFKQSPKHAFRTLRRVTLNQVLGLVTEEDRWEKAKGSIRGLGPRQTR